MSLNVGEVNKNGQQVTEKTALKSSTHAFAKVWMMKCTRCGYEYGANGCDAHIRRCPSVIEGVQLKILENKKYNFSMPNFTEWRITT